MFLEETSVMRLRRVCHSNFIYKSSTSYLLPIWFTSFLGAPDVFPEAFLLGHVEQRASLRSIEEPVQDVLLLHLDLVDALYQVQVRTRLEHAFFIFI